MEGGAAEHGFSTPDGRQVAGHGHLWSVNFSPQQLIRFSTIAGDGDFFGCTISGIEPFWMVYGNLMGFDG